MEQQAVQALLKQTTCYKQIHLAKENLKKLSIIYKKKG